MKLQITSPETIETHTIVWIEVYTPAGNFVIQPGHAPMIVTLEPNKPVTFRLKTGKQETITPEQGVLEVGRETANLLINK